MPALYGFFDHLRGHSQWVTQVQLIQNKLSVIIATIKHLTTN